MNKLSKVNLLSATPKLKSHIKLYLKGDGKVQLGIRRFKNEWFHKHFLLNRLSREIKVNFDEQSSQVLSLITGTKTVQEIVSELSNDAEYQERIVILINRLYRDKLIDLLVIS